jgi:WD40 repeat protein
MHFTKAQEAPHPKEAGPVSDTQVDHPDADALSNFGLGRLEPDAARTIEVHLEECDVCRGLVEAQADDSLVRLLRTSVYPQAVAATPDPNSATLPFNPATPCAIPDPGPRNVPAELAGHSRYRILAVLGTGGMGTVYRAQHLLMEREVALKVINRSLMGSANLVERFRREVRSAARLSHPNIVTAHDAEQAGDWHFLVMEYVPGISLSRLVAEKGTLSVVQACDYARQAALGLQHAFECGMVHRDIKPQNLMLTPAGQVKILDFGLSRLGNETAANANAAELTAVPTEQGGGGLASGSLTMTGVLMGTPDYIAPEQVRDAHAADTRADIYSLGCTLYHLLAGKPPFSGKTDLDKVLGHLDGSPRPLGELRSDVPAKLAAVVARMMARSPQDRYQTPGEAAKALAPFAGLAPTARSGGAWLAAIAAVLFLLAGLGIVSLVTRDRQRTSVPPAPAGEIIVDTVEKAGLLAFEQGGRRVQVLDLLNDSSCRIDPGNYDLSLTNAPDDLYLPVEHCQVKEGMPTTIRVQKVEVVREFRGPTQGDFFRVAFTPDGKHVLAAGRAISLRMWDRATGKEVSVFQERKGIDVPALAVSPDGRMVAQGIGSQIILSNLQTGADIASFEGHQRTVLALAFSPDGTRLLSGSSDRTMRLWSIESKEQLDQFALAISYGNLAGGDVSSVAFTPDGLYALSARRVRYTSHPPLQLWDLLEGRDEQRLNASAGTFFNVAIVSADGRRVLAGCDEKMTLWDLESGKELQRFTEHKGRVSCVAFLPDGRHVLSGSHDGTIRLWDVKSGRQRFCFSQHQGDIHAVAVAPDGCHALTAGADRVVRLWRMPVPDPLLTTSDRSGELIVDAVANAGFLLIKKNGRHVRTLDLQSERSCKLAEGDYDFSLANCPQHISLLAERCHIAPGARAMVRFEKMKVVNAYKGITVGGGVCVAVTPDGKRVLAGGWRNPPRMWDVETGKLLRVFDCPGPNNVFAIAVSPDGRTVAWGAGPFIRLSDLENGMELGVFKGHKPTVWGLSFSPDGTRLLSISDDGTMRLWDVAAKKQLDEFLIGKRLTCVAFTPDGNHALVGLGEHDNDHPPLQLWDLPGHRNLHRLDASRNVGQFCLAALSSDGRRVLSGTKDKIIRLWDLESGKEIQHFTGHGNHIRNLAFLPDGRRILSVSYDGTAKIWDMASGRLLNTFTRHRGQVKGVAIAPDRQHAFTVDDQGLVLRWRLPPPEPGL